MIGSKHCTWLGLPVGIRGGVSKAYGISLGGQRLTRAASASVPCNVRDVGKASKNLPIGRA